MSKVQEFQNRIAAVQAEAGAEGSHVIPAMITVTASDRAAAAAEVHELLAYAMEVANDKGIFTSFDVPPTQGVPMVNVHPVSAASSTVAVSRDSQAQQELHLSLTPSEEKVLHYIADRYEYAQFLQAHMEPVEDQTDDTGELHLYAISATNARRFADLVREESDGHLPMMAGELLQSVSRLLTKIPGAPQAQRNSPSEILAGLLAECKADPAMFEGMRPELEQIAAHIRGARALSNSRPAVGEAFTVLGADSESGQLFVDHVNAKSGLHAFLVAAQQRAGAEFFAAVRGHVTEDGDALVLPGESVVDADTVLEQPDVFGAAGDADAPEAAPTARPRMGG